MANEEEPKSEQPEPTPVDSAPAKKIESSDREVILSLISHTNVGKTSLARTLLRRDVGEVADRAHVTIASEAYSLIDHGDYSAKLWDTPGFGSNLAKLAKRLKKSGNAVGWIMHQVWDRFKDESLYCSQEAIRNIREDSDLVIYLGDASQSPQAIGYVDLEMEILTWVGKPVLVFLNQTGQPDPEQNAKDETEWREYLKDKDVVKSVSTLDAFTRCWTEEHHLLELTGEHIDSRKKAAVKILQQAWIDRDLSVFDDSLDALTELVVFCLLDTQKLKENSVINKFKSLIRANEKDPEMEKIQQAMYSRLADRTAETINSLIAFHGLDGQTAKELSETSQEELHFNRNVEEGLTAAVGGAVSGLVAGLSADLIAGGLTFGGGAIMGMLLGAGTTYALARGYNLTKTGINEVRWTEAHFESQLKFVFMLYLAVAHFGRGRGAWQDPESNPKIWESITDELIKSNDEVVKKLWKKGGADGNEKKLNKEVRKLMDQWLTTVLCRLYPESADMFKR